MDDVQMPDSIGRGQFGAPNITGGPPVVPPQQGARSGGLTLPGKPSGILAVAKVNVQIAMTLMEQALGEFGSGSEEGGAIIKALQSLSKSFGKQNADDLSEAQLKNMLAQSGVGAPAMPPPGGNPTLPGGGAPPPGAGMSGGGLPPELMKMLMGKL